MSNIATDHCHHEKKQPIVISSVPASVFASPVFVYASPPAFVYASPPAFFGFAPIFFHFALVLFGAGLANPETDHVKAYFLPAQDAIDPLTHGYDPSQVKCH